MRPHTTLLCVMLACCMITVPLQAQDVLMSFDAAGDVRLIDAKTEERLKLFPDITNLIEARLWRTADMMYALEITSGEVASPVRIRRILTAVEYQDLRSLYASAIIANPVPEVLDQSGRTKLILWNTIAGLAYYGTAMNYTLYGDTEWSASAAALPYLIAGGGGYLLTSLLTSNSVVTKGDAALSVNGLVQGPMHGWLLAGLISGKDTDISVGFGLSLLMGVGESVAGYYVSRNSNMSEGKAIVIGTTSAFGMLSMGMVGLTVVSAFKADADPNIRLVTGLALAGSVGGVVVGNMMATSQRYSAGDATVATFPTILCAAAPILASLTVKYDGDLEVITGLTAVTTIVGLWASDRLVVDKEFSDTQGMLVGLGTFGGALIGVGVGVLAKADEVTAALAWFGGALGFGITYASMSPEASVNARSMGDWRWNINPVAPLLARTMSGFSVPFISLSGRF